MTYIRNFPPSDWHTTMNISIIPNLVRVHIRVFTQRVGTLTEWLYHCNKSKQHLNPIQFASLKLTLRIRRVYVELIWVIIGVSDLYYHSLALTAVGKSQNLHSGCVFPPEMFPYINSYSFGVFLVYCWPASADLISDRFTTYRKHFYYIFLKILV